MTSPLPPGLGSVDREARPTRGNVSAPIKPHLNPPIHYATKRPHHRSVSAKIRTQTSGEGFALVIPEGAGPVNPRFLHLIFLLAVLRLFVGASR